MPTKAKIKMVDNLELREAIDSLYEEMDNLTIAKWALATAKHILEIVGIDYNNVDEILNGFNTNELWQIDEAKISDIRKYGFTIHKLAKDDKSDINKAALRVAGHAVSTGHMKEHGMVASDYAVKTIGLISGNDINAITNERKWQLDQLKKFLFNNI